MINKAVAVSPKMLTSMIIKYVSIRNNIYLQFHNCIQSFFEILQLKKKL
jgi:hypothetical protein